MWNLLLKPHEEKEMNTSAGIIILERCVSAIGAKRRPHLRMFINFLEENGLINWWLKRRDGGSDAKIKLPLINFLTSESFPPENWFFATYDLTENWPTEILGEWTRKKWENLNLEWKERIK